MRTLKMTLHDGNVYNFKHLPLDIVLAIKNDADKDEKMLRYAELKKKEEKEAKKGGLKIEELEELQELEEYVEKNEDKAIEELVRIVRLALQDSHPEFAFTNDSGQDAEVNKRVMKLMDMHSLMLVFNFAMSGALPTEENISIPEVIDLTQ